MLACLTALKSLRPQQGENQVTQQAGGDEAGKRIIENHFRSPSEAFTGVRLTNRHQKEAQPEA
jgi:hypothetical protein